MRAKIIRELNYFTAGRATNLTCEVRGSRPAPVINMWVGSRPLTLLHTEVSSLSGLAGAAGQRIFS